MKRLILFFILVALAAPGMCVTIESLERKAELNPKDANVQFNLGVLHFKAKNYGKAADALGKVTSLNPKDAEAWELYGKSLFNSGQGADAAGAFRNALEADPKPATKLKSLLGLGMALNKTQDLPGALEAYNAAAKMQPKNALVQENLGKLHAKAGSVEEATRAFQKAIKLNPKSEGAAIGLCQLYNQAGNYKEAIKACSEVLELNPKNKASAYYNKGYAHFRTDDKKNARELFEKAVALDKNLATAWYNLGFLDYEEGALDAALEKFRSALKARKGNYPEARYNVAVVLGDKGSWDEAATEYRKLLKKDKKNEDAQVNLEYVIERGTSELLEEGSAAFIAGQNQKAEEKWLATLRLDPGNTRATNFLKKLPTKTEAKPKKNAEVKEVKAKIESEDKKILDKGLAMLKKGELAGAVMQLQFYAKNHPGNSAAQKSLAQARSQLRRKVDHYMDLAGLKVKAGDMAGARQNLNLALDLEPDNARANAMIKELTGKVSSQKASKEDLQKMYFNGVNAYLDGDLDKAVKVWAKVLKQDPDHLDARRSMERAQIEVAALKSRTK